MQAVGGCSRLLDVVECVAESEALEATKLLSPSTQQPCRPLRMPSVPGNAEPQSASPHTARCRGPESQLLLKSLAVAQAIVLSLTLSVSSPNVSAPTALLPSCLSFLIGTGPISAIYGLPRGFHVGLGIVGKDPPDAQSYKRATNILQGGH